MDLFRPVPIDPSGSAGPTKSMAAGPSWRRASPGLYVPAYVDPTIADQRILEAACRLKAGGAVTGWAALRLHGVPYCDGRGRLVPLVVPPGTRVRTTAGVVIRRERLGDEEFRYVDGIAVTSPYRAAFDEARVAPDLRAAVLVLDLALTARVIARAGFRAYLETKGAWPGVRQVRRALPLADDRCRSPMESRLRLIWRFDARLPPPKCNWPIADALGTFIGSPDLLSEELAVIGEFDGAEHRKRSRHRDDLRRDDAFRRVGLEPFRVVGADLEDNRLVLRRITEAIERSKASPVPRSWRVKRNPPPLP